VSVYLVGLSPEAGEVQLPLQQQNSEDVVAQQQQQNGSVKGPSAPMVEPQVALPLQQDNDCKCRTTQLNASHMFCHSILNSYAFLHSNQKIPGLNLDTTTLKVLSLSHTPNPEWLCLGQVWEFFDCTTYTFNNC
jgi:hypothetical protein